MFPLWFEPHGSLISAGFQMSTPKRRVKAKDVLQAF